MASKKLLNLEDCQKWCQDVPECEMFVYSTTAFNKEDEPNVCYLKNKMASELTTQQMKVAGPKVCPIYDEGKCVNN